MTTNFTDSFTGETFDFAPHVTLPEGTVTDTMVAGGGGEAEVHLMMADGSEYMFMFAADGTYVETAMLWPDYATFTVNADGTLTPISLHDYVDPANTNTEDDAAIAAELAGAVPYADTGFVVSLSSSLMALGALDHLII